MENAYEQLLVEGYVWTREKSGYYVNHLEQGIGLRAEGTKHETTGEGWQSEETQKVYFADFTSNYKVYEKFPFSTWTKVMRETLSYHDKELLEIVPSQGVYRLREAIARHLYQFRGMQVSPEQIVVGAGTEYLYGRLIQLLGRECVYGLENPGYLKMARLYKSHGLEYRYVNMDEQGIRIDALEESGADVVHVSPGHHFPVGFVMPVMRRQELLKWAQEKRGRYIVEDDYDSEFRLNIRPVPAMQTMDASHRVIYLNTFSRTLFPSMRVGYMVLPNKLLERYKETVSFYACSVSAFEQYALADFMEKGCYERHIRKMKLYYKEKRDMLIEELKQSSLWKKCRIIEENAGTRFLLKVDTTLTDSQIKWCADERGLKLSCLTQYCHMPPENCWGILLISYGDIPKERMREAVQRLASIFE